MAERKALEVAPQEEAAAAAVPLCQVVFCPICMAVGAVGEVRPELMQHVLLAGREMLMAIRAVIDARLEGTPPQSKDRLERLRIE